MPRKNLSKRLIGLIAAGFLIAFIYSGCATPQEVHDYVAEKMAATAIVPPANLNQDVMASKTYEYWARSAAAVSLCTDGRNFESGDVSEQARAQRNTGQGMLGQEIIEYITGLPTANVDAAAIKAVTLFADNYDTMDAYYEAVQNVQTDMGTKWAGVLINAMDGIDSIEDIDFDKTMDTIMGNVDGKDIKGIKSAVDGYTKMQKLGHLTYGRLVRGRRELSAKYHADFSEFRINTRYASSCGLPWYL